MTSRSPLPNATGVQLDANISATLSEAIDPATLTQATFEIKETLSGAPVTAVVLLDPTWRIATLDPNLPLRHPTSYTVTLRGGPRACVDAADNPMAADVTWSFTTEAPIVCPCTIWPAHGGADASCPTTPTISRPSRRASSSASGSAPTGTARSPVSGSTRPRRTSGAHTGTLWTEAGVRARHRHVHRGDRIGLAADAVRIAGAGRGGPDLRRVVPRAGGPVLGGRRLFPAAFSASYTRPPLRALPSGLRRARTACTPTARACSRPALVQPQQLLGGRGVRAGAEHRAGGGGRQLQHERGCDADGDVAGRPRQRHRREHRSVDRRSWSAGRRTACVALNANGSFTYMPNPNFHGTDSFVYKANDGADDSLPTTVTITVVSVNDLPAAGADSYTVDEDTTLTVTAPGVLGNDTDADGNPLTAVMVSGPAHGVADAGPERQLRLHAERQLQRQRQLHLQGGRRHGAVSPGYRVDHGRAGGGSAGRPSSDATGRRGRDPVDAAPGVLGNDTDADGSPLTAALVNRPASTVRVTSERATAASPTRRARTSPAATASSTAPATARRTRTSRRSRSRSAPVNDAPSFTKGADQTVLEDAGAQTVAAGPPRSAPGPPTRPVRR